MKLKVSLTSGCVFHTAVHYKAWIIKKSTLSISNHTCISTKLQSQFNTKCLLEMPNQLWNTDRCRTNYQKHLKKELLCVMWRKGVHSRNCNCCYYKRLPVRHEPYTTLGIPLTPKSRLLVGKKHVLCMI